MSFAFSSPFLYDGMVYVGQPTFVKCAEEGRRFGECAALKICVESSTTWQDTAKDLFPSTYIEVASTADELLSRLDLGRCNVAGYERHGPMIKYLADKGYVVGEKKMNKEPNAFVTRGDDREFSDAVNWVLQALIYGEENGLKKDVTLCKNSTDLDSYQVSDLDFMNAVYCVGNYGEIMGAQRTDGGKNHINRGKSGMMYAIPFGKIDRDFNLGYLQGTLESIRNDGRLKCGVLTPPDFKPNLAENKGLMGMGIDYCHALASALFVGDSDSVDIFTFPNSDNSSYMSLTNGTVDVLAGGKVQKKFDFGSDSLQGFDFSTSYYYGDSESDVSVYSMVTRQDDLLFSYFVDIIVLGSIYAQENGITSDDRLNMPQVTLFGVELTWALRDSVEYAGNYDEIYEKNFGSNYTGETRGRNAVNQGGPLMLSRPGLPD